MVKDQQELLTPKFQVSRWVTGTLAVNLGKAVQNDLLIKDLFTNYGGFFSHKYLMYIHQKMDCTFAENNLLA